MHDYLVFQLYAPLASWGDIAVGEQRGSFSYPTKSAMLGLLAAALGIRRTDETRLQALNGSLGFATRVESDGVLLRDYHTIQTPDASVRPLHTRRDEVSVPAKNLHTLLSTREYRCDAVYLIAFWCFPDASFTLESLYTALLQPHFVLYLGRKSCPPSMPLAPEILRGIGSVPDAFTSYSQAGKDFLGSIVDPERKSARLFSDLDGDEMHQIEQQRFIRRDQPGSRLRWQFSEREESYSNIRIRKEGET